jgi:hypothetical protein
MNPTTQRERATFVPALRDPAPIVVEVETSPAMLPPPPQNVLMPRAGYEDRARGFGIATAPLAGVVGFVVALVAIVGWSVPIASLATLLAALGGFAGTWLVAYIAHVLISPDGALFAHTVLMWRYLRREQAERHRRYRKAVEHGRK